MSTASTSSCPHMYSAVGQMTAPDFEKLTSVPKCDICSAGPQDLWLCLYPDCYMLGCSEGKDHSTVHNHKNDQHSIQINIGNKKIWCYKCNNLIEFRQEWQNRFGALIPPPEDGVNTALSSDNPDPNRTFIPQGLVGLVNLGNTCYMNAALQCLLNTPAFAEFFLQCSAIVDHGDRNNLSKNMKKLVSEVWKNQPSKSYTSPSGVMYAMKAAFPMFRGFHQHDSQEFLRCLMDVLHEELMEPVIHATSNESDADLDAMSEVGSNVGGSDVELDEYETADSGVSEDSSISGEAAKVNSNSSSHQGEDSMNADTVLNTTANSEVELEFMDAASDAMSSHSGSPLSSSPRALCRLSPRSPSMSASVIHKRQPVAYRSVISDIFDGKLVSSVQCLTCDRVSKTTEAFQDLSLPIPTQDSLPSIRNQPKSPEEDNGWLSWMYNWISEFFYGPSITLIDCLNFFFSVDELKEDNMYSCERCKKLRNGLKFSRVTILPDTLCIHLKRFRHEFAFSSKVSTKVTFPLVDLDMSPWLHKDSVSKVSSYDLSGVICHHGSAGGGHYTAYVLNPLDEEWYEFDDSVVTKVEAAAVMNLEAYVLFYRKNSTHNDAIKQEFQSLLAMDEQQPGLVKFFVSRQWINKFSFLSEPGPIDNSDFLCPHGGVLPKKTSYVYDLCLALPQSAWEMLHQRYGGGPSCNRLYECTQCAQELEILNKQKKFELEEFKSLHDKYQEQDQHTAIYCLSSSWFRLWEGFVTDRSRDPPGQIDNRSIITTTTGNSSGSATAQTLRTTSDYLQISEDIWHLFQSIYGGGPEVVVKPNGTIYVSSPNSQKKALYWRSSSLSSNLSRPSSSSIMTRSKTKSASEEHLYSSPSSVSTQEMEGSEL